MTETLKHQNGMKPTKKGKYDKSLKDRKDKFRGVRKCSKVKK